MGGARRDEGEDGRRCGAEEKGMEGGRGARSRKNKAVAVPSVFEKLRSGGLIFVPDC